MKKQNRILYFQEKKGRLGELLKEIESVKNSFKDPLQTGYK